MIGRIPPLQSILLVASLVLTSSFGFLAQHPCIVEHVPRVEVPSASSKASTMNNAYHARHLRSPRVFNRCTMLASSAEVGKFFKMGGSEDTASFGPRCVLAGGLTPSEVSAIRAVIEEEDKVDGEGDGKTPLVLYTSDLSGKTLGDVLGDAANICGRQAAGSGTGQGIEDDVVPLLSPVILLSGFSNPEVRGVAARFRQVSGGVRAAFAKAVPNAMSKTLGRLYGEIAQDHADALSGRLKGPPPRA